MNKKIYKKKEIIKIKKHIYNTFSHAQKIDVKIEKGKKGVFKTIIKVKVPQKKELLAIKTAENPYKSLEKSHVAINKQISKLKSRWKRTHRPGIKQLFVA